MKRITFDKQANAASFKRLDIPQKQFGVNGERSVGGYTAIWDVISVYTGGEFALFPKGSAVLPVYQVRCLYNHNEDFLLAVESNGSLAINQDDVGISVTANLDGTFIDDYVYTKVSKGTIGGMSVGMYPIMSHIERRIVTAFDAEQNVELSDYVGVEIPITVYDEWLLDEVTFTGNPAFPQTTAESFSRAVEGTKAEIVENTDTYKRELNLCSLDLD